LRRYLFLRALPAYLGGKRRLAPLILARLANILPRSAWSHTSFLDPFSGGGAVSLCAKAQGFRVISSDVAERANIVSRALIANSGVRLSREDVLDLFREPPGEYPRIAASHSPKVFSSHQADWIDRALARARRRGDPIRSMLLLLIVKGVLRCQPMSMLRGTDARAAATGDFDRVSPRRLGHYMKARRLFTPERVWAIAEEVNAGVFGGIGEARSADAVTVIGETPADVVYLDLPYAGTSRYEREYQVLDDLLADHEPASASPLELDSLLNAAN
jgi:hypothetical protein